MAYTQLYSGLGWGTTFEMNGKKPLIAKRSFPTLEDAYGYVNDLTATGTACPGLIISVTADTDNKNNGIYWIESVGKADGEGNLISGNLVKAGGTETIRVDKYSIALDLSSSLSIGQLIFVENEDEVDASGNSDDSDETKITYKSGFYIVNGSKSISALGTTSGADDEIGALESRVSSVEGRVTTLESDRVLTDDFEKYQTEISGHLAGKVDMSVYETHVSKFEEFTTSVSTTLDSHAATLTSISTTLTSISDKLDNHVSVYTTFVETTNDTLGSHATSLSSISSDLTTHVSAFESYQTEVSELFVGVNAEFEEVTTSISTLTSDFNNFKNSYITDVEIEALFNTNSEQ